MKNRHIMASAIAVIGAVAIIAGCTSTKPPTPTEAKLYNIQTNLVPVVVTVTNTVQHTNEVSVTNQVDHTVTTTNVVTPEAVVSQQTIEKPTYTYLTRPAITDTIKAAGAASGPFTAGIGTMVGGGLALLYGIWGSFRSTKLKQTALATTQEMEAVRDYILTLPQGVKIDAAVTGFLQKHQVEAGVAGEVMKLIDGNTSNSTVIGVSQGLQDAIAELTKPTPPAAPAIVPKPA